eukprot:jgi/Mesvir1/7720/Mv11666-RA.1
MSTAGSHEELNKRKQLALEWMKKWDLDGDGAMSSLEMKGAAMEHVKLQRDYKNRGIWMIILAILIFCCGGVILGVSIWANAISKDSKVEAGEDLGGYTMRKKDGSAVVKTATALYEFALPRIGFLPFDELSTIESISFLTNKSIRQMSVEGFRWFGTNNITFFSPRNEQLTIARSEPNVSMTFRPHTPGAAPWVIYEGIDPDLGLQLLLQEIIDNMVAARVPLTAHSVAAVMRAVYIEGLFDRVLPTECIQPGLTFIFAGNMTALQEPCATLVVAAFEGFGIVEAKIGPQDYYGTEMSAEEKAGLTGYSVKVQGGLFNPDPVATYQIYWDYLEAQVKAHS